ncbi:YigZ family protein [Nocardioides alcanivorans]|uniref:YigZ family protein n=1 Tax=Nocardioides alcanivorans TaxID=2897352 RepID=UPI001F3FBC37|nr:YigZ family protein [Nocardioides alcanivorans]
MSSYLTLARDGEAEIEVKRSRFRCTLVRVEEEADARAVVERLRKEHWDARHHCSAFVIGPGADLQRSSDDGEPAGTAGAPMLEVLRGHQVSDAVAVVTRWFGGVLLGAGGLVRAYGDAVRVGLEEVGTLRRDLLTLHDLEVGHAEAGRVETDLRSRGITVLGADYTAVVTLHVALGAHQVERWPELVAELTTGAGHTTYIGSRWVDVSV